MEVFEIVIALLLGGALLAAIARRIATPYPALVAIAGAALALVPGMPTWCSIPNWRSHSLSHRCCSMQRSTHRSATSGRTGVLWPASLSAPS